LCHPSLHNWISEEGYDPETPSEAQKERIRMLYEQQSMPDWFWKYLTKPTNIWRFNKTKTAKIKRKLQGNLYIKAATTLYYLNPVRNNIKRRILDKSLNNCLRLDLVKSIFPEARFIYVKRHGLATIKSLINGWLNPDRFITFYPPDPINIVGYNRPEWKFVMPSGWQNFNNRHLAELCTWQWKICHENILALKQSYPNIFLEIKMEELTNNPQPVFKKIADFSDIPEDNFSAYTTNKIPRLNQTPAEAGEDFPFPEFLDYIKDEIRPMMKKLGYE